jgi:hypothetical protein
MRNISNILGVVVKLCKVHAKNYSRIVMTKAAFKKKKKKRRKRRRKRRRRRRRRRSR